MAGRASELQLRVISAFVLAVIAFGAVWAGGFVFAAFVSIMALIVLLEWTAIIGLTAFENARLSAAALMVAVLLLLFLFGGGVALVAMLVCAIAAYFLLQTTTSETANWTAAALLYCGAAAIALVGLRDGSSGAASILLLFAIVWGTDIGAYFVGRKIGGPKLAPAISPGKTQSGAVGGLVIAIICAVAVCYGTGVLALSTAVWVALVVSVISQTGDLFESFLKRRFNVKDSGTLIPGHGGVFDRVDGLMPAAISLYVLFKFI